MNNGKLENDKATMEWLNSLKKGSKSTYKTAWKYFLETASYILGS